jgi:ribose transport system ATP-binding protein
MNKLEMTGISKSFFGVPVLQNVSMMVEKGSIHALIGENGAGKSTLMNILAGVYSKDGGILCLDGKDVPEMTVKKAEGFGIAFVHQEVNLFNDLMVYENLFINKEITRHGLVDKKEEIRQSEALFQDLQVAIKATDYVRNLTTGEKQLLEIVRALFTHADLFILDEPTTALSNQEIANFFRIIRNLRNQGNTFIFISHKMPEIFALCDSYTVLRNGRLISTGKIQDVTPDEITEQIVGDKNSQNVAYSERPLGETILELRNCSGVGFHDISFQVRKGEIIGFTGLQGSGSSELMQAIFGLTKFSSGEVLFRNHDLKGKSVRKVMQAGIGMVPSNRKENSVFGDETILDNICYAEFSVTGGLIFHKRNEMLAYCQYQKELGIKANSSQDLLVSLSGGNQQKVIVARWLKTDAPLLLLDNPTQGIDVGAKSEIYRLLLRLAASGKTILFNTLEIPEIQKCADRCFVFYHGAIEKILSRNEITEKAVMTYATNANKTEVKIHG